MRTSHRSDTFFSSDETTDCITHCCWIIHDDKVLAKISLQCITNVLITKVLCTSRKEPVDFVLLLQFLDDSCSRNIRLNAITNPCTHFRWLDKRIRSFITNEKEISFLLAFLQTVKCCMTGHKIHG